MSGRLIPDMYWWKEKFPLLDEHFRGYMAWTGHWQGPTVVVEFRSEEDLKSSDGGRLGKAHLDIFLQGGFHCPDGSYLLILKEGLGKTTCKVLSANRDSRELCIASPSTMETFHDLMRTCFRKERMLSWKRGRVALFLIPLP